MDSGDFVGDYCLGQIIFPSANSTVYETSMNGQKLVAKLIPDHIDRTLVDNEIRISHTLSHYAILPVHDCFEIPGYTVIITPYCVNGDVFEYVRRMGHLQEEIAAMIFYQIIDAVRYMHELEICHRDIKPENFFLGDIRTGVVTCYLSDFGFSAIFDPAEKMRQWLGSLMTAAPEILRQIPYDEAVDVWGLGVSLFFCVIGYYPFQLDQYNRDELVYDEVFEINSPEFEELAPDLQNLIGAMLSLDPDSRPSCADILNHPWFQRLCPTGVGELVRETKMQTAYDGALGQAALIQQTEDPVY